MTTTTEPTNPIYCVKCRTKTESRNVERVTMKNRPARDKCEMPRLRNQEVSHRPVGQRQRGHRGVPPVAAQNKLVRQECSRCRIRKQNATDLSA